MKTYKLIDVAWASLLEDRLNELASEGWVVKSVNLAYEGEDNSSEKCIALLEYDDENYNISDLYSQLESINDKLDYISDKIPSSHDSSLDNVLKEMRGIKQTLDSIDNNTER